ncbi:MAG: Holliday junction resolvase RuvX [Ilumatobacteraceae bacterium]|jgi:putative Holliday junction resolvase|nr:Holliday junction resolvase RuvX [Ilumatobacteraceae bacterium]
MRALGVDLGTKRIGLATSDLSGTIATPLSTLERSHSTRSDHASLARIIMDEEVEIVVIGLPIQMNGELGMAAEAAQREAALLATVLDVPVILFDERMTTVAADRALKEANISASRRRRYVDRVAAAVMLQSWLDRGCPQ